MDRILKILHLEDMATDAELVGIELKRARIAFKKMDVDNKADYIKAIDEYRPDIILSDHSLPSFNSVEALEILKRKALNIPFILVTATISEEFAVTIMKEGASDYILKDRMQRLPSSILNAVEKFRLAADRERYLNDIIESEALLKQAEDIALIGSLDINLVNGARKWSAGMDKILGYHPGELAPSFEVFLSCVHLNDVERVKHEIDQSIAHHDKIDMEFRIVTPQNEIKQVHSKLIITKDKNGRAVRASGFIQDVTERKTAEIKLNEANQEIKTLFNTIDEVFFSRDMVNAQLIQISPGCEKMYGYSQAEFLADAGIWSRIIHPDDLLFQSENNKKHTNGETVISQYRIFHKTKGLRWAESKVIPTLDEYGALVRLDGVTRDITERKQAEEHIYNSHLSLREVLETQTAILDALPPHICVLNENGDIIAVNESWKRFARENKLKMPHFGLGYNYIAVTEKTTGEEAVTAKKMSKGIQTIMAGEAGEFSLEYPCDSHAEKRWFQAVVAPLNDKKHKGAVIVHINITDRKLAEQNRFHSEQRYRQIVETAQEGIWMIDENFVTLFVNKKMCDILGYTAEEIIGKHNYDFKEIGSKEETIRRLKYKNQQAIEPYDTEFITKKGKKVICSVSINSIFNPDGSYLGYLGMLTDITQRKAHEEALKKSEANLSAIIENTTDLVYSLDRELKFITFNKLFKTTIKQVYGFEVEQGTSSLHLLRGYDAEGAEKWTEIYNKALDGETQHFINEYPVTNGKVYLSYSVNPIWETGEVIGLSCFSRDITQQKLDEAAVIKSEANMRSVFENTDLAIALFNNDLELVSFNTNAAKLAIKNFGKELVAGKSVFSYFGDDRKANIEKYVTKARNKEPVDYETAYDQFDGTREYYDVKWIGVFNQQNESVGIIFTLNNITSKKISELEREKITADLIRRNRDLEQFTYIISHNLRAPLANIKGLSTVLNYFDIDDVEFLKTLKSLSSSVDNLDGVIVDLNQILQTGRQVTELSETVSLKGLVGEIITEISPMIVKNDVSINCNFDELNDLFVLKSYIYSIFQNLIINSIKYRNLKTTPVINIKTKLVENRVQITFEDNGKGIDLAKYGAHLFGLYKRFDFSVEGKGMGLFMVKMQVESIGGTINIESEPDKGTTFLVELPL
ncbi:PAS domain S-box protein [Mucilaginibacter gotjawali]|uniref:histidine kinase n=1 Tax=Mucilaginibacter gotjawali TaxID=1550579 RepID=A0A839S9A9_9SPHI|nr:PAS domain S-box protein [Mucilaginibacter gotjawali]MBB3054721.1 PAS domain S-box-containing protein [Mucilaginibacter gotjawali]